MSIDGARNASVKDVAALAGVSLGTVSNTLNRPDRVSEATRLKVERAMAELGFVRNESARQLRAGTSRTLAYVMLDAGNPFFTDVAQGIEEAADAAGLSLVLCNSAQRAGPRGRLPRPVPAAAGPGVLVTPVDPASPTLDAIRDRGTPLVIVDRTRARRVVLLGRASTTSSAVGSRSSTSSTAATSGSPSSAGRPSWARCASASRVRARRGSDAGRPAEDLVVLHTPALGVAAGREAGERLAGMPARRRPTAAFCANDMTALGLLQQAISSGVRVPEKLAIVGYDDIEFASAAAVPLTSVRQPRDELGRTAARLLLDEAANPDHAHEQVLFTPELVARASTA